MKTNKILGASILALSAMVATPAMAQTPGGGGAGGAGGTGLDKARGEHYWKDSSGKIWNDASGKCWRDTTWSAANANAECDPDLVPKPAPRRAAPPAPPPAPRAAPTPVPPKKAPAPVAAKPKPAPCGAKVILAADNAFTFGKATLQRKSLASLEKEIEAKVAETTKKCGSVVGIKITGHSDRIGSQLGNLKLSEKRANAVKAALAKKLPKVNIETMGMGKTMPIHTCPDTKNRKELIKCLAPNRRVEVEINGPRK